MEWVIGLIAAVTGLIGVPAAFFTAKMTASSQKDTAEVEEYILDGTPINEFRRVHPERVSVLHRFIKAGHIPKFTIITNGNDFRIKEQRNFMNWVRQSSLPKDGLNLLIETDQTFGHTVLKKDRLVPFVNP